MMERNLFIKSDGQVIEDGSESAVSCYVKRGAEGFWPIGVVHGRRLFISITREQWTDIQRNIKASGGCLVGTQSSGV